MWLDPTIQIVVRAGFFLLFAGAAAHKLREYDAFKAAVSGYCNALGLPNRISAERIAPLIVVLEIVAAATCVLPGWSTASSLLVGGICLLYATLMAITLQRGGSLQDCGCSWGQSSQSVEYALVFRNVVLASLASLIAVDVLPRALAWLDIVNIGAGAVTVALSYAVMNQLIANRQLERGSMR